MIDTHRQGLQIYAGRYYDPGRRKDGQTLEQYHCHRAVRIMDGQ